MVFLTLNNNIESGLKFLDRLKETKIDPLKNLVNGINAKLSGSAEIDSIINKDGLGAIKEVTQIKMIEKDKEGNDQYQIIKSSDIVKGNKKATNRLSGMKIEDITDNKTVLDYADSAVKTLLNVIDKVEKVKNRDGSESIKPNVFNKETNSMESVKLRDSLFRGILFNADGSINKNVATAIAIIGDDLDRGSLLQNTFFQIFRQDNDTIHFPDKNAFPQFFNRLARQFDIVVFFQVVLEGIA